VSTGYRLLIACGVVALCLAAFGIWRIAQLPVQPTHPARARVVAIAPNEGHFHVDRNFVFVRNKTGFGQFSIVDSELHCRVGDEVTVQQQGVTLTRLPSTCREGR